ncbi:MAG: hypothetical protein ABL931_02960 [Usitatibacteraceae bacterium]
MNLDRALGGNPFRIDLIKCHEMGAQLSQYKGERETEAWSDAAPIDQFVFKTLFISICHQMNWDVLQSALAGWLLPSPSQRLKEFSATSPSTVTELLDGYPKKERILPRERAAMLRSSAIALEALIEDKPRFESFFADPTLAGPNGFYETIRCIPAFNGDPLDKKPRVLAHDLYREGILRFQDPENLLPAVEYHLIRLYLRTGRVYPINDAVRSELTGDAKPTRRDRLVRLLRETVDEAMRSTAFFAGLDVATLNYLEWQLARSLCIPELDGSRTNQFCTARTNDKLPEDICSITPSGCPFRSDCRSLNDPYYSWYREPTFQKAIY